MISLKGIRMIAVQTDPLGVVSRDTIFDFSQIDNTVTAIYQGGLIEKGFLIGNLEGDRISFVYCQKQKDEQLDHGVSLGFLRSSEEGKLQLVEHFEWKSRPGQSGINVFEQIEAQL